MWLSNFFKKNKPDILGNVIYPEMEVKGDYNELLMITMNDGLKKEIIDSLNFTVNSGYYDKDDIIDVSKEYLEEIFTNYGLSFPTKEGIEKIITDIHNNQLKKTNQKNYKKLQGVFDQLNSEGIISIDYAGFDMSEGHEEVGQVYEFMKKNNVDRNGYCFFHQQDIERSMDPQIKSLFLAFHSLNGDEKEALKVGKRIVNLLNQAHFEVNWDESLNTRICIKNFIWDKEFSNELVSTERAIKIIQQCNRL